MSIKAALLGLILIFASMGSFGQKLPNLVTRYLDQDFSRWKFAGQCSGEKHNAVISGDFDGNKKRDYVVKFVRGNKGFMMAFLNNGRRYKAFYLHFFTADEANFSYLTLFKKGEQYEPAGTPKLKFDSPADFQCESDIGGVHAYIGGKFVAY